MPKPVTIGLLLASMFLPSGWFTAGQSQAAAGSIRLTDLRSICIPAQPNDAERSMAEVLREKLRALYGVELTVAAERKADAPAILLGREAVLAAGAMTVAELQAVKTDGYIIKGNEKGVALAGYAPQGTVYATYAFLRRAGLKLYPWRNFEAVEIREPVPGGVLEPFTVAGKPYFDRRDLLGYLDGGRWGASLTEYSLGDFRTLQEHPCFKGKGWLGADHTAPYLVPMALYRDAHPEYYAMHDSKRLPKDTQNCRVALCLSNPAVHRIAAGRALEWMESQSGRRFFHITDGDTRECRCPECTTLDSDPGSCTDRYLKWVNSVAGVVRELFPENVVMALAYGNTTRPPLETTPAPNVVVLYCPWYWNSRTTSAVGWANPLNLTAMKEFTAWAMRFPGQVGLYDYPDSWVHGQAERLKLLAKRGVRIFYACGGQGDLYQWVNARLLWDPFLNTEDLVEEFARAYYGPAAGPMGQYLRLKQDTIERRLVHSRDPFVDANFLQQSRDLMVRAEQAARSADDRTQARILAGVLEGRGLVLPYSHPVTGAAELRLDAARYRQDLEQFGKSSVQVADLCERLKNRFAARMQRRGFAEQMQSLGLAPANGDSPAERDGKADAQRALATFDQQLEKSRVGQTHGAADPPPPFKPFAFDQPGEAAKWLSDGSRAELVTLPEMSTVDGPHSSKQTGVHIRAPLVRLPVIAHGKLKIHAGRFYAERIFDPPLDVGVCPFLDFHVWASADVPVTIYINEVHSDVDLHAGEQIVRVDLRNFDQKGRFSYHEWDKQVRRIGFDLWPQDNYYPYPQANDVEVVFLGMSAANRKPAPERLPHAGRAIWLSQFRPNLPRGVAVPRELYDKYMQRGRYKHVGLDYGSRWINERFRTFTEHRAVSPIFSIVIAPNGSPAERSAAANLQECLEKMFALRLPVCTEEAKTLARLGNAIVLGRQACLAAGRVTREELQYVGPGGLLINAHQGRIAIAGPDDCGTASGALRYLEDHGARFCSPERTRIPDRRNDFLHELYLADWPYFREQFADLALPGTGRWLESGPRAAATPAARGAGATWVSASKASELLVAKALAETIKDCARTGGKELPPSVAAQASRSPLCRYVAGRLLHDPWADAARLIREFTDSPLD